MPDHEEKILCHCFRVPESEIRDVVASEALQRVSEVTALTRAGGGCFSCWPEIEAILQGTPGSPGEQEGDLERCRKLQKLVKALLEHEIDPLFAMNGIRATLLDVAENRILVQFEGAWEGDPPPSFEALRGHFQDKISLVSGEKIDLCEGKLGRDEGTGLPTL